MRAGGGGGEGGVRGARGRAGEPSTCTPVQAGVACSNSDMLTALQQKKPFKQSSSHWRLGAFCSKTTMDANQ